MKVILLKELKGKGGEGDVIDVAPGFANNYLLTQGYAILATKGNLKQLEQKRKNIAKREEVRIANATELKGQLDHHADDEESDQFPKLRRAVSAEELVDLGRKVEAAKKVAPTRPHPDSPHSELFHMTVGLGVGMVDRLRDALSGRIENT